MAVLPEFTAVLFYPSEVTAVLLRPSTTIKQYASSQYPPLLSLTFTTKHVFVFPNFVIERIQLHNMKKPNCFFGKDNITV